MRVEVTTIGLPFEHENAEREAMAQEQGRRKFVELPDGATVKDLLGKVEGAAQQVQKILVNGADAGEQDRLHDGDAVALVGQVSGIYRATFLYAKASATIMPSHWEGGSIPSRCAKVGATSAWVMGWGRR
ncbi:MAG: MoaD/ThiS family protein [Chloroflexi bacterium]|nr:MoaD/ThiS family protein [Chloroflexota bacterium]